jgi:hypothetical protein
VTMAVRCVYAPRRTPEPVSLLPHHRRGEVQRDLRVHAAAGPGRRGAGQPGRDPVRRRSPRTPERPRPRGNHPQQICNHRERQPTDPVRPAQTPSLGSDPGREPPATTVPAARETRALEALTLHTPGGIAFPHAQQAVRITRTRTVATTGKTSRKTALPHRLSTTSDTPPADLQDRARRERLTETPSTTPRRNTP